MRKSKTELETVELEIEAIGFEGIAIARDPGGMAVFVKGAAPGDIVEAEIFRRKKNYAEARIKKIIKPSPKRVAPRCEHFGVCGGCSWQHLDYEEQIVWKRRHVEDCFERIGKIKPDLIEKTARAETIYNYRNKMEFSFGASRWLVDEELRSDVEIKRDFALGLHVPGRFDKVLDVNRCHIQPELGNDMLLAFRESAKELGAACYNERTCEGFLRNLAIRSGGGEIMAILITKTPQTAADRLMLNWFETKFIEKFPEAQAIHAINDTLSPVAAGLPRVISGKGSLTETVAGIEFRISPFSFFQTNPSQIEIFLNAVFEVGQIGGENVVWDLYCGAGTISLPTARRGIGRVIGAELNESAVSDARANAERNGITNAEFHCIDLHRPEALALLRELPSPDCVILDPPRAGAHPRIIDHLLAVLPPRIVYVSCNPATQARDCAALAERYAVRRVRPVDMFPHTFHIESVALLERV